MRVGEGLVGVIAATARPLALADAQSHPDFAYRPETGEENYHSLMGVPILRGGRVLGVLVVQNRSLRHYTEDEIEVLQTIAMVVAELARERELVNPLEIAQSRAGGLLPVRLVGHPAQRRAGSGTGGPARTQAADPASRRRGRRHRAGRLRQAVAAMREAIDELVATSRDFGIGEHRDVLETYRMFAADRGWVRRIADAIRSGLTAEAAVQKVREDTRARMMQVSDPYLRERLHDLEDLANRLQQHLSGEARSAAWAELPPEFILVARAMGPAELMDYARRRIKGLVLEEGSPTAHVAIVARAFDIPVVGRVEDATSRIEAGDIVVVDGDHAQVLIRPSADIRQAVAAAVEARSRRRAFYDTLRAVPPVTRDGIAIRLLLNAGLLIDLPQLRRPARRASGSFAPRSRSWCGTRFPDVEEQTAILSTRLRSGREPPGGLPYPRYRRRQGAALPAARGRGQSGDGLAGDPHRARPAGHAAPAAAGADPRRRGAAIVRQVSR